MRAGSVALTCAAAAAGVTGFAVATGSTGRSLRNRGGGGLGKADVP